MPIPQASPSRVGNLHSLRLNLRLIPAAYCLFFPRPTELPWTAVIRDVPAISPVARPVFTPMLATDGVPDAHATPVVIFGVVPSL